MSTNPLVAALEPTCTEAHVDVINHPITLNTANISAAISLKRLADFCDWVKTVAEEERAKG